MIAKITAQGKAMELWQKWSIKFWSNTSFTEPRSGINKSYGRKKNISLNKRAAHANKYYQTKLQ